MGSLGALRLQQESSPLANSAIAYAYDELGRLASRTVAGAGAETFHYDAIGRLITHASDLGSFTLGYLGQTGQLASRTLASSTLATNWSYLPNSGDRRLAGIGNTGLTAGQFSNYAYTTTPENQISGITESSDVSTVYPVSGTQTATYNTGAFRPGAGSYETGKFFAESGEDAMSWGNAMEGPGNFRVVQGEFSNSSADQFVRFNRLDGIGPARFGTYDQLGQPSISLWPGSP